MAPEAPRDLSSTKHANSTTRTATWISLVTVGIFSTLLGVCAGWPSFLFVLVAHIPPFSELPLATFSYFLLPTGFGVGDIICALKIRKGSRRATITSIVLVGIQLLIALACIGLVFELIDGNHLAQGDNKTLYVLPSIAVVACVATAILLFRTLREPELVPSPK